jgi:hypothetical protein
MAQRERTHHRGHREHGGKQLDFLRDLRVLCGECFLPDGRQNGVLAAFFQSFSVSPFPPKAYN